MEPVHVSVLGSVRGALLPRYHKLRHRNDHHERPRPNVVFIVADDLGWNELGYQNASRGLLTPNIDSLATAGVRLDQYYVAPLCTPTRSMFMTGRHVTQLGLQANVIYWDTPWGVGLNETFLPENMADAGYTTAMFGKWHLGSFRAEHTPTERGFDTHRGYLQGCTSAYTHVAAACDIPFFVPDEEEEEEEENGKDYEGYDWFRDGEVDFSANETFSALLIRDAAVEYIHNASLSSTPFFMYLPFQQVHNPITVDQEFVDMQTSESCTAHGDEMRTLCGMLSALDAAIGDVVFALNATGQLDNTVIAFTSDNGAPTSADPSGAIRNFPLRGHKSTVWEGGTRVPAFLWSQAIADSSAGGTVNSGLMHATDWLPTLVAVAGGDTARNLDPLDGFDMWDSLTVPGTPSPRSEVLYDLNPLAGQQIAQSAALRVDDMKVVVMGPLDDASSSVSLFNLTCDPSERNDLADEAEFADTLAALVARLGEIAAEAVEPMVWTAPYQGENYYCRDCPLGNQTVVDGTPVWLPWR